MNETAYVLGPVELSELAKDALAFRVLMRMCRTLVSQGFQERFTVGAGADGLLEYTWTGDGGEYPSVKWMPGESTPLTEIEIHMIATGYAAMVMFPAILATLDTDPDALSSLHEGTVVISGPMLGRIEVMR